MRLPDKIAFDPHEAAPRRVVVVDDDDDDGALFCYAPADSAEHSDAAARFLLRSRTMRHSA